MAILMARMMGRCLVMLMATEDEEEREWIGAAATDCQPERDGRRRAP